MLCGYERGDGGDPSHEDDDSQPRHTMTSLVSFVLELSPVDGQASEGKILETCSGRCLTCPGGIFSISSFVISSTSLKSRPSATNVATSGTKCLEQLAMM